jgi:multiple RNA-binding domain-containing protein 1
LVVWNLPKYLTEQRFKEHFEQKGQVTDVKIVKTKDGRSRQFGFIGYKTEQQAKAAKKHFDQTYFDTRKIIVEMAKPVSIPAFSLTSLIFLLSNCG